MGKFMRYLEARNKDMFQCMWKLNGKFKQRGVNKILLIQVNKDANSRRIDHIQEICTVIFPIGSKTKE